MVGCVDGSINAKLNGPCDSTGVAQYNYSSIEKFSVHYGGDGVNFENWTGIYFRGLSFTLILTLILTPTGPGCLLAFGFAIFVPSVIWCMCICCDRFIPGLPIPGSVGQKDENIEDDFQFI